MFFGNLSLGENILGNILLFFHCKFNTGYAIAPLEKAFYSVAQHLGYKDEQIYMGYTSIDGYFSDSFFAKTNVIEFNYKDYSIENIEKIQYDLKSNNITVAFGFDLPVDNAIYKKMRKAGVQLLVSYWGAAMSSINNGLALFFKKIQVFLNGYQPDHYIFESQAMADTAIYGRGIPKSKTTIVPLGIDTDLYKPSDEKSTYVHTVFNIPEHRKIIFYSGHMEERKGVHVLIKAAVELTVSLKQKDYHVVILGNKNNEEKRFDDLYKGTEAEQYITFGGYRDDVPKILPSCFCGVIPSTGWDSFPRTSLEILSCGLPLIGSRLQGIVEQIEDGENGYLFDVGDYKKLAKLLNILLSDSVLHARLSDNARKTAIEKFSIDTQIDRLTTVMRECMKKI